VRSAVTAHPERLSVTRDEMVMGRMVTPLLPPAPPPHEKPAPHARPTPHKRDAR
jgi:hypothetical protein